MGCPKLIKISTPNWTASYCTILLRIVSASPQRSNRKISKSVIEADQTPLIYYSLEHTTSWLKTFTNFLTNKGCEYTNSLQVTYSKFFLNWRTKNKRCKHSMNKQLSHFPKVKISQIFSLKEHSATLLTV